MKKITLIFMLFISFAGFAQLPLEGFEGTWTPLSGTAGPAGPAGWYIKNVSGPAQTWNQATNGSATPVTYGTKAAYLNRETVAAGQVAEDWLITPQFTVPNNAQLKFWSRLTQNNDQGSNYKVMIGTDPTDATTFTDLQTWTELTLNSVQQEYEQKVVNIPAANVGLPRYIAFVMTNNNGDRWLIDEVQVVEQCFVPTALAANPSGTSAVLNWTSTSTNFEVEVLPFADNATGVGVATTGTTYTTPATLTPSTAYKYYVRAVCAEGNYSPWAGPFAFNTSQIAGTLNFSDGFEGPLQWSFVNGTQVNQWVYGTATANGGTHSLYISNDGTSNAYTVSPTQSVVTAYRDIQMPAAVDQLTLSFDWKGQGESIYDYLRVWLVPVSYTPVAGTQTTAANSGGIQIGGNLNLSGAWQTNTSTINAAAFAGTVRRLVFEWRNDTSAGTQPPAAIDNINLSLITCPAPTNLAISNVTQNSATFSWTGPTSVSPTFDFYYSTNNTAPTAVTTPTANVTLPGVTLPGLSPTTTYYYWVRSNCGTGDTSTWVGPITFTTTQVPATLNYTQNFEGVHNFAFDNGTQTNKWTVGTATSNGGTHSLYITNDNGVSNAYTISPFANSSTVHAYRDILIPAGTAEVDLSFDWKSVGESCCDYLRVWMVPASYTPVAGTLMTAGNSGGVQVGGNFNVTSAWTTYTNTINVSGYAGQIRRLVFEWRNDGSLGTQPPAAVDNIVMSIVTCPKPTALATAVTSTSANLSWTPQGTEGSWEVYVVPTGSAAPTATTVGVPASVATGTPYSPLTPSTTYQYYVRALCSTSDKSTWAGPFSFTTSIANDNCDGAVTLTVNTGQTCTAITPAVFTGANASATPACFGANGPDIWFQFTAANTSHVVQLTGFDIYTAAAQNVVIGLYESNCGALGASLFCSNVNYMLATDLVPGQVYLVRATLNPPTGTPAQLTTGFDVCVTTPPPPTAGNASDCVITTINPSFEQPSIAFGGLNNSTVSQNVVPGWRTTAQDGMIEFWPVPNNVGVAGAAGSSGTWFIELNANFSSAVYQDFATPQPTTFTVQFAHRGRQGVDVMRLLAGDANAPDFTGYTQVGPNFSDGTAAWGYYGQDGSLTYTVPAGQTNTRFVFQAVSTSSGDPTIGNFLDEIRFTANNGILSANPAAADCTSNVVNAQAAGSGTWTAHTDNPSATVIGSPNSNTTTISGFSVPGVYLYDWTTDYCTSTLTINYTAPEIAIPTGTTSYTYCEGATATTLTATGLAGYTLNWYDVPAGGTPLASAPTPDTTVPGTYTFYVGQTLDICESPRLEITVTVNDVPDAPVTADVSYCQDAVATALTATTATGNTANWYDVATGGTALATVPTPDTSVSGTTTYYVSQTTAEGCESPRTPLVVTVNAPATQVTAFTLPATVCIAGTNPTATLDATTVTGGTFTSSAAGLVIDATTGEIDLAQSTAGAYQVTYTVAADVTTCVALSSSTQPITITPVTTPVTGFQYPELCISAANQLPVLDPGFTAGGTFTSSDAGLVIDPVTGEINMAASTAGNYTVTVTFTQDGVNCTAAATNTATVTITPLAAPVTGFSYAAVCGLATTLNPALATNFTTGGTFTADAAVTIDATTGIIDVANTAPGNYNVTYTLAQNDANCVAGATVTVPVTINTPAVPVVSFTYTNVCATAANQLPVLSTGFQAGGSFTAPTGLFINPATGEINMSASTPGTYIVTYTFAADATSCTAANTGTFTFTISPVITPVTGFDYEGAYCFGTASVVPDLDANFSAGGTFTVTGGLTINPATGEITNLAAAAPGEYTVTYSVAANPATCTVASTDTDTFTINAEITFEIDGECNGAAYVLTATPTNASFDPALVSYQWSTANGTPVGSDSAEFNVTDYVNSTTAVETFPMDFVLTVTANGCDEPVTYTVEDISCEIQRGISPGGTEGMNDYFDLASLGVRKLTIFNRYGEEVYAKNNYTTEWVGQTNKGDELPTGTYFYVIDRNVGETKTGWIYINRQN